jgi:hypothetical protein
MIRVLLFATLPAVLVPLTSGAQSLARRVADAPDGAVQFTFASHSGVCGDGATYVRDGLGDDSRIYDGGNFSGRSRSGSDWPPCEPGPVRIVAQLSGGDVIRLHTFAGAPNDRVARNVHDLGIVSVNEAVSFLSSLVQQARGRASSDAVVPISLADSISPWPILLRFARDERLPRNVRSTVAFWLSRGAAAKLGVAGRDDDADDDVRASAVFALSQQPKDVAIPQLIELARHSPHAAARAQALFWLGQSGDPRATDVFEEILGRR